MLEAKNVTVRYGALTILEDISFALDEGQWLMVIGPNGAGKSTLINAVARAIPYAGTVTCMGADVKSYKPHELARRMGVLSQAHFVGYSFTVGEVARLGRYAYSPGIFSKKQDNDEAKVLAALELTGLAEIADQSVLTLSGGELQRAFLAQVLAQDPAILILDEPTNHLDLVYQKQIFALIRDWLKTPGRAAISVVHDLSLAKAYGTHALLLDHGRTVAQGRAGEVFSPENLSCAYSMDVYEWMQQMLGQWKEA